MSTFNGIIKEIPFISVDRFDQLDSSQINAIFLSHCHTDHMIGLFELNQAIFTVPVYVSCISAVILRKQFGNIKNIYRLPIGVPTQITLKNNDDDELLMVTTIPAGHCPGSVMFLFEYKNSRILYTGDFRLRLKDIKNINIFKDSFGDLLKINTIYLDSTFFNKKYLNFPTQFYSTKLIIKFIEEWLANGENYIVSIKTPARYGSEYLIKEISEKLNQKIHVNLSESKIYSYIPELDNCITTNPNNCKIHVCYDYKQKTRNNLNCRQIVQNIEYLRVIRPSALFWENWKITDDIYKKDYYMSGASININYTGGGAVAAAGDSYRICYSSHSSYNEIKEFLEFFKPDNVELNVIPQNDKEREQMFNDLTEIMKNYQSGYKIGEELNNKTDLAITYKFKLFPKNRVHQNNIFNRNIDLSSIEIEDSEQQSNCIILPKRKKI